MENMTISLRDLVQARVCVKKSNLKTYKIVVHVCRVGNVTISLRDLVQARAYVRNQAKPQKNARYNTFSGNIVVWTAGPAQLDLA